MRLVALVVGLLLAPALTLADKPDRVKVTNRKPIPVEVQEPLEVALPDPLPVQVVNPSPPSAPSRIQIVGVTAATYVGGEIGGPWGANQACHAEFPGSRMCTNREVVQSLPPFPVIDPLLGAWVDDTVRVNSRENCNWWTYSSGISGAIILADGSAFLGECTVERAIACCAPRP